MRQVKPFLNYVDKKFISLTSYLLLQINCKCNFLFAQGNGQKLHLWYNHTSICSTNNQHQLTSAVCLDVYSRPAMYKEAPGHSTRFCYHRSIKSELISGMCDTCKWEEKAILPDTWHPLKLGDHCHPFNCVSFMYRALIRFPMFFFILHTVSCVTIITLQWFCIPYCDDLSVVVLSCHSWCDLAVCPPVTDLQPLRIMIMIYGRLCSGVLRNLWTVLLNLCPSCCYLTAPQRDCSPVGQKVAAVILTTALDRLNDICSVEMWETKRP